MKIALIDLGSNTIRLVIYVVNGENVEQILNERVFVGVAEYIENGVLSEIGICKIISALEKLYDLGMLIGFKEIYCFATASLRNIKNSDKVKEIVEKKVGFEIDILSEEDEIKYDYEGLKKATGEESGIGLDLGGGSCQVFAFNQKLKNSVSLPIGSLAMYKKFVKGLIPKQSEIKEIKKFVKRNIKYRRDFEQIGLEYIYCMGGTARAALKLYNKMCREEVQKNEIKEIEMDVDNEMDVDKINFIIEEIYKSKSDGIKFICHVIPERVYTIIPGLIVLQTVCKYVGAKKIKTAKGSVREGYLWKKILEKQSL